MKANYKHVFSTKDQVLSKEEIEKYVKGKISEKEKHRIELLLASNPFLADAVEGFQNYPESIGSVKQNPYSSTAGNFTSWLGILTGILAVGVGFWYFNQESNKVNISTTIKTKNVQKNNENLQKAPEESIIVVESHYSDSSIQITSKRTKNKIELPQEKYAKIEEKQIIKDDNQPISIEGKNNTSTIPSDTPDKNVEKTTTYDTYHIVDYIVYDYRGKREEPIKTLVPITNGTPANQENKNSADEELNPTTKVFYDNYLKQAIIQYSKENYKQASKKFKIILKKYPNDVNALFYEAMCSFNRNKNKRAIEEFYAYLNQPIDLFAEDAAYFLALALLNDGDTNAAHKRLTEIVAEGGFYKEQAQKLLKK